MWDRVTVGVFMPTIVPTTVVVVVAWTIVPTKGSVVRICENFVCIRNCVLWVACLVQFPPKVSVHTGTTPANC